MTIAIDFGTSNTIVARWNQVRPQPETLKLPGLSAISAQNPQLIPSPATTVRNFYRKSYLSIVS